MIRAQQSGESGRSAAGRSDAAQGSGSAPRFTALVLAGERAGEKASLAAARGAPCKALLPVAGRPMLEYVLETLNAAESVGKVVVCGMQDPVPESLRAQADWIPAAGAGPAASVLAALNRLAFPVLVTTADHPLLLPGTVDEFSRLASATGADVVAGVVRAERIREQFAQSRRTYIRFRDAAVSGANLFALLTPRARAAVAGWVEVERYRKRPWRMISMLGPLTVARFLLGRLTLRDTAALISRRIGIRADVVLVEDARAAVDVDSAEDLELAERILSGH